MSNDYFDNFGVYTPTALQSILIGVGRRAPILKTFFRTRLNRLVNYVRPGPIDGELFGLKYRFHPHLSLADRKALFTPNKYDRYEREFLSDQIKKNGVFFDIGSNVGVYSLFVGSKRPDVKVHSFEPISEVFNYLKFNIDINRLGVNISPNNIAISDASGQAFFSTENESMVFGEKTISIDCLTLLDYMDRAGVDSVDAIKIDVEGAEDKVLKPFFENAKPSAWPKFIVIEHLFPEIWQWNCLSEIEALGYQAVWRGPMNTIYKLG